MGGPEGEVYMVQSGQDSCRMCGDQISRERLQAVGLGRDVRPPVQRCKHSRVRTAGVQAA